MKLAHLIGFAEVFLLAAAPAWAQSPTGASFLHGHTATADTIMALYAGWRALDHVLSAQAAAANPTVPVETGETKG